MQAIICDGCDKSLARYEEHFEIEISHNPEHEEYSTECAIMHLCPDCFKNGRPGLHGFWDKIEEDAAVRRQRIRQAVQKVVGERTDGGPTDG